MNELISIIVPVYNVEKYLEKCVFSITNQTYKNIEIILVDDGSTDISGEICDKLSKKDSRIRVFHKENGGLSDARNYGIKKAKGKYVGLVDSDDFIKEDMYEILYKAIKKYNADISMCRVLDCYGRIPHIDNSNSVSVLLNTREAIKKIMEAQDVSVHAVSKLYKKSLFNTLNFEVGRITEDGIIMIELFSKCKKIAYDSSFGYYYIHRENSITTSEFSKRNYDVIYAYKKNYCLIEKNYPELLDIAKMRLCWAYFNVLDKIVKSNSNVDKNIIKYLRGNIVFILKSKYFTKSRKIAAIALRISYKLYKIIVKKFYNISRKNYQDEVINEKDS